VGPTNILPPNSEFQSAMRIAILSPAVKMLTIEDFEASFDEVRFRLDIALNKAQSDRDKAAVQQVVQQLFNLYTQLVVRMIVETKGATTDGFLEKIRSGQNFAELAREFQLVECVTIVTLSTLGNSVVGFAQKLYRDHQLGKRTQKFHLQVARTYRKIVTSKIYSDRYALISDAIDRLAMDIIKAMVSLSEFEEGIEFVALLKTRNAFKATQVETELVDGYRRSLMMGVKGIARLFTYAYINFLLVFWIPVLLILMYWYPACLVLLAVDIGAIRYFWRFGPQVSKFRKRINQRTAALKH
jgi:hypothetical protein